MCEIVLICISDTQLIGKKGPRSKTFLARFWIGALEILQIIDYEI